MMRYLLLISAVFWCLVVQAVTPSSYICPIGDAMGSAWDVSADLVYVPMQQPAPKKVSCKVVQSREAMPDRVYNSRRLFSLGQSATSVTTCNSSLSETLLSERGFSSTSAFRDGEQSYNSVRFDANTPSSVVRKGPPGQDSSTSTGEWMPLPDALSFLMVLVAIYGISKRHQQRAGQSHASK